MTFQLGLRRAVSIDIAEEMKGKKPPLSKDELTAFEDFDLIYRSLCALMYNYVPTSGHPGGSISSGRFVQGIIFDAMDYDIGDPDRDDADIISYAAGHKALGLYAMWALRNEVARIAAPDLLPKEMEHQFRLEDLLGFRRNPITKTPLYTKFKCKHLDGHPTPATPFVKLSTGASGVGVASSLGLAFGAADYYDDAAPRVHIVEGEGGMTPGRVSESLASAGTSCLRNAILHVDWNQASIDSNRVCREGKEPGEYVQWTPAELCYLHDWNVILVEDGTDFNQIIAAQRRAKSLQTTQPTAIIYQTIKGWRYGIEGKASHGAGHKLCSGGFYEALAQLMGNAADKFPRCADGDFKCKRTVDGAKIMEECFWKSLELIRGEMERCSAPKGLAERLAKAKERLAGLGRAPRKGAPDVEAVYAAAEKGASRTPKEFILEPGSSTTLRAELGKSLSYYNSVSGGAIFAAAADLLGSTSTNLVAKGFPDGYYNAATNKGARLMSIGGICEDAISGVMSGLASLGHHIGEASSYGAFIAPLGHIAARLHAIGNQARKEVTGGHYRPMILTCAHAGLKTGEDGPTHADPQALQLLQENFPQGTIITLTPWDPAEIFTLFSAALARRPAILAPFVTRPTEKVLDRKSLGLADSTLAAQGIYLLKGAEGRSQGTIVLQGSGVTYSFVSGALPLIEEEGLNLNVYYVASAELFDMLPASEQQRIFPEEHAQEAMGITGFTLPTMYRWVTSDFGRSMTLHPFQRGHYLGSGQAEMVLAEAGLDGASQFKSIMKYIKELRK